MATSAPATSSPARPRVFIDAHVLFAGAASPSEHGAGLTVLRLAEITLIDAIASRQIPVEAECNLAAKLPATLPAFHLLIDRCLTLVTDPLPAQLAPIRGLADPKDWPILAVAVLNEYHWLVTFNTRHYQPGHSNVTVVPPGLFIRRVSHLLSSL